MSVGWRLLLVNVLANASGAALAIFYLTQLRVIGTRETELASRGTLHALAIAVPILAAAVLDGRRRFRPLGAWIRSSEQDAGPPAELQRRALELPLSAALRSYVGWVVAGAVSSLHAGLAGPPAEPGRLPIAQILIGTVGIAGPIAAVVSYFAVERVWRPVVPRFFPRGGLRELPAFRLPMRQRLLVLFAVGVAPVVVLALLTYDLAAQIATSPDPSRLLPRLYQLDLLVVGVSILAAIVLARSVAASVVEPLEQLGRHFERVRRGDLELRAPVTSNDEIGELADGFNAMVDGLRREETIRELFGRYVTREVAEHAIRHGAAPGGELLEASVLFADIRGFTTLTERSAPEALIAMLNRYYRLASAVIVEHGGMINKYGGDSLLAVFGTPLNPADDHARRALAAALDLPAALERFNADQRRRAEPTIEIGIGVATGPILAGNVGSDDRLEYTVIGDAVNVASRLQAMTRELDATILVADGTARAIADGHALEQVGQLPIRGKHEPVVVYAARR
jgi:adenylate cyclase